MDSQSFSRVEEEIIILEDLWMYDIENGYWLEVPHSGKELWPSARTKHSAVMYDQVSF